MHRYLLYALLLLAVATILLYLLFQKDRYAEDIQSLEQGKNLFVKNCSACHGVEADGIGPRLGGITRLLPKKDLISFITNPSQVIATGNERAVALLKRYKQVMPAFALTEPEITSILAYVHHQTSMHDIVPLSVDTDTTHLGLTGRLVKPVKVGGLKIEMEEVIQIPRIAGTSPDLGIVTLRAHPSGDGTLFVSDQNGILYRISRGNAEVFLDVRKHISNFQSGPGIATGVGSFDFHPDYLNNGLIYITHAETFKGQKADFVISDSIQSEVQWVVSEWKMADIRDSVFRGTRRELLRLHAPTFAHGAQDMAFIPGLEKSDPDYGLLYLGYGDGGANNIKRPALGDNLKSFLGSILRIDPLGNNSKNGRYGIPSDNPFVHEPDSNVIKEIYAYGFRNPHRMAWDHDNGNRMIVTDIGESNIEEINIVEKGGNYGWPSHEGTYGIVTTKDLKTVFKITKSDLEIYKNPFAEYDHVVGNAISGGYLYEGNITSLKNKYIFGDIVNGKLFYVNIDPHLSDSTIYEFAIIENDKATDLREMSHTKRLHLRIGYDRFKKEMYVITKADGKIRRIKKAYG